ncbi:MAG: hypothetical protein GX882_03670 [Methanomicrobiales archaeon]|nr:hypothetical protein [Methanomicrobiales archaeon]
MHEYAPGIVGEVRFARQDGGYYVVLYSQEGEEAGRTGLWRTEAKAREAARRLAERLSEK